MTITIAIAATTALLFNTSERVSNSQRADVSGPTAELFAPSGQEPRQLAERLGAEIRDTEWADATEASLRSAHAALAGAERLTGIATRCARTICEVTGTIAMTGDVNTTMRSLQDQSITVAGIQQMSIVFGQQGKFASYWTRERH